MPGKPVNWNLERLKGEAIDSLERIKEYVGAEDKVEEIIKKIKSLG